MGYPFASASGTAAIVDVGTDGSRLEPIEEGTIEDRQVDTVVNPE
jgi:hypothetical protein